MTSMLSSIECDGSIDASIDLEGIESLSSREERVDGEIEREIHRSSMDDARAVLTTMDAIDRISANLVLDPDFRT